MPSVIETPRELAIRLLADNRDHIGRSVYQLTCRLQPHWADVDENAFVHNTHTVLRAVQDYLAGGDPEVIINLARDLLRVRRLAGFTGPEFHLALHTYLPVVRKAFLARAPTMRQGLAAFDVAESICLPLFSRLLEAIARADEQTAPDARPPFHGRPFEEVSVGDQMPAFLREPADEESDEDRTDPHARRPARRS